MFGTGAQVEFRIFEGAGFTEPRDRIREARHAVVFDRSEDRFDEG
jgi:hypothetical protein